MTSDPDDERLKRLVLDYFGGSGRIRLLRDAPIFGAPVFVVDFDQGMRHFRTLGSFGTIAPVTEQSSMDVLYPARLVFHYERLMSLAFAMSERQTEALLLGVGGAAMWRFVRAYLPECAMTLVDSDDAVVDIARRWFFLNQRVALEDAQQFVAGTRARFDVVLIDLYHAGGPAEMGAPFWTRCLDALAPGGCLANNWADFATNPAVKPMAETLSAVARSRGLGRYSSPDGGSATTSCNTCRPPPASRRPRSPRRSTASPTSGACRTGAAASSKTAWSGPNSRSCERRRRRLPLLSGSGPLTLGRPNPVGRLLAVARLRASAPHSAPASSLTCRCVASGGFGV